MSIVRSRRLWRMSLFGALLIVAILAAVALASAVGAHHCKGGHSTDPGCDAGGGGGGGGGKDTVTYDVFLVAPQHALGSGFESPTYSPGDLVPPCIATAHEDNYSAKFPRHDLCATVVMSTGAKLTDDIKIAVNYKRGCITSVQLWGQDVIGREGIMHASEVVTIDPPLCPPPASDFALHVDTDNIAICKLKQHLGGPCVEIVGSISLGDLLYVVR